MWVPSSFDIDGRESVERLANDAVVVVVIAVAEAAVGFVGTGECFGFELWCSWRRRRALSV